MSNEQRHAASSELKAIRRKSLKIEPLRTMAALTQWAKRHEVTLPLVQLGRYPIFMILCRAEKAF